MKLIVSILLAVIIINLQSCKTQKPAASSETGQALQDIYWRLTELMGKPIGVTPNGKREIHIKLISEGKKVEAFAGCNGVGGTYEINAGNRIRFSNLIGTMMACDEMATENSLLEALKMTDNYSLNGNTMTLNKARMVPLARFEAVVK
jgi:heat shock protein HslJ